MTLEHGQRELKDLLQGGNLPEGLSALFDEIRDGIEAITSKNNYVKSDDLLDLIVAGVDTSEIDIRAARESFISGETDGEGPIFQAVGASWDEIRRVFTTDKAA